MINLNVEPVLAYLQLDGKGIISTLIISVNVRLRIMCKGLMLLNDGQGVGIIAGIYGDVRLEGGGFSLCFIKVHKVVEVGSLLKAMLLAFC